MQSLLNLNRVGLKGLNSDIVPWDLPPDYITEGINFRIVAEGIQSSGGYNHLSTNGQQLYPGRLYFVNANQANFWLIACRNSIYAFDGANWTNISNQEGYTGLGPDDELKWSGGMLGSIPVISNPQDYPQYWGPVALGQQMQYLDFGPGETWQDVGYRCNILRVHKNFLFALGLHEGANTYRDAYRWSNPADINGLPFTWDETDLSAIAGRAQLGGDGGSILDGLSLRDSFCIYSENAIDLLDFVGGEFVWRRRELSSTLGLLSKDCVVEVKGSHFLLADGDILRNDGNSLDSIIHNRLRRRIALNASTDYYKRSFVVRNNSLKEIWFCVPESGAEYPNIAYIYNWRDNSWVVRDLHPDLAHIDYGVQELPGQTWDQSIGNWDNQTITWNGNNTTPENNTLLSINNALTSINIIDPKDIPDEEFETVISRTNFPMEGHKNVSTITRLYPHIEGNSPLLIQIGSHDFAGGPIRWSPNFVFTPGKDRKVDVRSTGTLHAWRLKSINSDPWRFSGMDIEYTVNGTR